MEQRGRTGAQGIAGCQQKVTEGEDENKKSAKWETDSTPDKVMAQQTGATAALLSGWVGVPGVRSLTIPSV